MRFPLFFECTVEYGYEGEEDLYFLSRMVALAAYVDVGGRKGVAPQGK